MHLFRIARLTYLADLSGTGARMFGGRWNSEGTSMLYTSSSLSLALLETLAHSNLDSIPGEFGHIMLEVPDSASQTLLPINDLPIDWRMFPAPIELQERGDRWIASGASLLLRVPSVILEVEFNWLVNPLHPEFSTIKMVRQDKLELDQRIISHLKT
jgi:RES domain-containing protein